MNHQHTNPTPASSATAPVTLLEHPARRVVVIGSGSMGSGIAALIASSGAEVTLLDMAAEGDDRNARATKGRDLQVKRRGFTHPSFAERITVGNTEDDLDAVAEADWVVEAIFENLDAKRSLYRNLEPRLGPNTVLSSNTSTLPLAQLSAELTRETQARFFITHFFNPPRVMPLVELIAAPSVPESRREWMAAVIEQQLGKRALPCRDTPGFIANRVGNLWMAVGAGWALENEVPIELADAIASRPFGVPRTGIFGLFDYIGLQLVPDVWGSTASAVGPNDAYHRWNMAEHPLFQGLIKRGLTGRTGESGFYRGREEVITEDYTYRSIELPDDAALHAKNLAELLATDSLGGEFARQVLARTVHYCCTVGPEIADTVEDIDLAMVLGYGWKQGPFALADSVGIERTISLITECGLDVPTLLEQAKAAGGFYPDAEHTLSTLGSPVELRGQQAAVSIAALRATKGVTILESRDAAELFLLPNGMAVFHTLTKLGTLNPEALDVLESAAEHSEIRGLVLTHHDERALCAGADVSHLAAAARDEDEQRFAALLDHGLRAFRAVKYAPFPVVAAVRGVALGGGAEMSLHADARVVHVDARIGFPERSVGLFPAWGGPIQHLTQAIEAGVDDPHNTVYAFAMEATPAKGAYAAQALGLLTAQDQVVMSAAHVLAQALERVGELAEGYTPPQEPTLPLASSLQWWDEQREALDTADAAVGAALADLMTGKQDQTESELNRRSTACCVEVFREPASRERIATAMDRIGRR